VSAPWRVLRDWGDLGHLFDVGSVGRWGSRVKTAACIEGDERGARRQLSGASLLAAVGSRATLRAARTPHGRPAHLRPAVPPHNGAGAENEHIMRSTEEA